MAKTEGDAIPIWLETILDPVGLLLYEDEIPYGEPDGVVVSQQSATDVALNGRDLSHVHTVYQVKLVRETNNYNDCSDDATLMHGLLQGAAGHVVEGYSIIQCTRQSPIRYKSGREPTFSHVGGTYRIDVEKI